MTIPIGPFLRQQLKIMVRSEKAIWERQGAVLGVVGSLFIAWFSFDASTYGDRSTIAGARLYGKAAFGYLLWFQMIDLYKAVRQVASSIPSERERQSLDSLLTSRLSSAEIVLGVVAASLFRWVNAVTATVPCVLLLIFLGVVHPTRAIVSGLWLASIALMMMAISVWASVGAKTATTAVFNAWGAIGAWLVVPALYGFIRPYYWPGAPSWLSSASSVLYDAGPLGLLASFSIPIGPPFGPVEAFGWQGLVSLALIGWSVARLRPATRALYDHEAGLGRLKKLRSGVRRASRRRPCGDDPMFWLEIHAGRRPGLARRLLVGSVSLALLAGLGLVLWRVAGPAFRELAERGYGPSPEVFALKFAEFGRTNPLEPAPGLARFGLNITIRFLSLFITLGTIIAIQFWPVESIRGDRKRGTWADLLVTPLTTGEILRGKALGALWRGRFGILTLLTLWSIGLASGAVHPLGFVISIAGLIAMIAHSLTSGLNLALLECKIENTPPASALELASGLSYRQIVWLLGVIVVGLIVLLALFAISVPFLLVAMMAGPLSPEDVSAVIQDGPFPEFGDLPIPGWIGARAILLAWLVGVGIIASHCIRTRRTIVRAFDACVGRPVRPTPGPEADKIEKLRSSAAP